MKHTVITICAIAALLACTKERPQTSTKLRFNITVEQTKALKTDWEEDDIIFIFFSGIGSGKYLEYKYTGTTWVETEKNGLEDSDITGAADKKLTAIYLPYASGTAVTASGFEPPYQGWYLQATNVSYTIEENEVTAYLNMQQPSLPAGEYLAQFYVTDGNVNYEMYASSVYPITVDIADGNITLTKGDAEDALKGYAYSGGQVYSGIIGSGAHDMEFSINNAAGSILYTRTAGEKTITGNIAVNLGNIGAWTATPYQYMYYKVDGKRVMWATENLGATSPEARGNYYTWEEAGVAVKSNLHGLWRLPSVEEYNKLLDAPLKSVFENPYPTQARFMLAYPHLGEGIILPAAGYKVGSDIENETAIFYWAAEPGSDTDNAYCLLTTYWNDPKVLEVTEFDKALGFQVRPVFSIK